MIPRPRTLCLLVGIIYILFGMYGLFQSLLAEIHLPNPYAIEKIEQVIPILPATFTDGIIEKVKTFHSDHFILSVCGIVLVLFVLIYFLGGKGIPKARGKERLHIACLIVVRIILVWLIFSWFTYLSENALSDWMTYLMIGGAISLVVLLFNIETINDRWLGIVMKSATFVTLGIVALLLMYIFAIYENQQDKVIQGLAQKKYDDTSYQSFLNESLNNENNIANIASKYEDLINSDRQIALKIARNLCVKNLTNPNNSLWEIIFPLPTYKINQKYWLDAVKNLTSTSKPASFEGCLQKILYGNEEGLAYKVPYRTYIYNLRKERIKLSTQKKIILDNSFRGTVADFASQLSLRTLDELKELPVHCTIVYDKDRKVASSIAEKLKAKNQFIIPAERETDTSLFVDKKMATSIYISVFARSLEPEHIKTIQTIIDCCPKTENQNLYPDYSILEKIKTILISDNSEKEEKINESITLSRELSEIDDYVQYGNMKNHIEIWVRHIDSKPK